METPAQLETEKIGSLLWRFSLPAITGMVVNALYNVVDSIFVGRGVGEIGLAAVTVAFPIMILMMGFGMLVGVGASALVSIRLGQGCQAAAEEILGNALALTAVIAVILAGVLSAFLDPVLIWLGSGPEVLPHARAFTRIIIGGSLFMYIGFGLNNIIRAEGNPRLAMATMLISAFINTVLNPLFIFGLGLGIAGSALATVVAQTVSAVWVVAHFLSPRSTLKLRLRNLGWRRDTVLEILKIGFSPFMMQIAAGVVVFLYNYGLLAHGGAIAVAAYGVISRIAMLILMPIFGISQGVQPIIGYNYGARRYGRVKAAVRLAAAAAVAIATAGLITVEVLDVHIIRLFNADPALVAIGAFGLRVNLLMLPLIGFQVIGANYFQAVGKASQAAMLSMSRQVIILIPLVITLPRLFGLEGIWFAAPVSDLLSALLTGAFLYSEFRRLI